MNKSMENITERNHGIDILRLLSMFMVVMLHVSTQCGFLYLGEPFTIKGEFLWFIEISSYCAVNVFALISGYLGIKSKHRAKNIIALSMQVVFYSILFTIISLTICLINDNPITVSTIIYYLFPTLFSKYWYFSAYFCLFFIMPILDKALELPKSTLKKIFIFVLFVFMGYNLLRGGFSHLSEGYSVLWLAVLYVIGGYISKYNPFKNISKKLCLLGYFLCVALTQLSRILLEMVTIAVFNAPKRTNLLVSYLSPTIFFAAVFLLILFSKIEIRGESTRKIIVTLSSTAFGIYLIHGHPFIYDNMYGLALYFSNLPVILIILIEIAIALLIFIVSIALDYLRKKIFKLLRVEMLCVVIENLFSKIFWGFVKDKESLMETSMQNNSE